MKKIITIALCLMGLQFATLAQTGSLDPSFGNNGIVTGYGGSVFCSCIQPDGKIVIAGSANYSGNSIDIGVTRFLENGSIDSSFGVNGISFMPYLGSSEYPNSILLQSDGKIVVAGHDDSNFPKIFAFRLHGDGGIDSSFAVDGRLVYSKPSVYFHHPIINQISVGRFIISGSTDFEPIQRPFHLRLKADGTVDSAFGVNGLVQTFGLPFQTPSASTKINAAGKIIFSSSDLTSGVYSIRIMQLDTMGVLDPSFGTGGIVSVTFPKIAPIEEIVIMPDQKIVVGGTTGQGTTPPNSSIVGYLCRFNTNGTLDASFGSSGKVFYNASSPETRCNGIALQPSDNKIVMFGSKEIANGTTKAFVARFNTNGTFDTEFGNPNFAYNPSYLEVFEEGKVMPDGKILGVGYASPPSGGNNRLMVKFIACSNTISSQPLSTSKEEGMSATFTAISSSPSATYQWQIMGATDWENLTNGGQYAGVQSASLSVNNLSLVNNGAMFRTISQSGMCIDTSNVAQLTVTPSTGISEIELAQKISISPNPFRSKLAIHGEVAIKSIKIYDVLGRTISTFEIGNLKSTEITLPSSIPAGVYWINISTLEGHVSYKIVKE